MSSILEKHLDALDGRAIDTTRRLARSALATLLARAKSRRRLERALVLECLGQVRNDEASQAIVEGLDDRALHVRQVALRMLGRDASPAARPRLLALMAESTHPEVRGGAALLLARMGGGEVRPGMADQRRRESDPNAARQMDIGLAKLGDADRMKLLLDRLSARDARSRYQAIADLEYVNDRKYVEHLVPLLRDEAAVLNIGGHNAVWHRVCDRAVNGVVAMSALRPTFAVGLRCYTSAERNDLLQAIRPLLGSGGQAPQRIHR